MQKQLHQSEESRIAEQTSKEKLEKEVANEQQEHAKLLERYQASTRQIEDCKSENVRLHQLANNIQANLEHYQNAMRELRTEQNLAVEKQQMQFQQEIAELQREMTSLHKQLKEYEQQIVHNNSELKQLHLLHQQYENMKNVMQDSSHQLTLLGERCEQYQQQLKVVNNDVTEKNKHIVECEKQIAILADHNQRLQTQLLSAEEKIELLRQEKLFLAQEKSELKGHLDQLEKMVN